MGSTSVKLTNVDCRKKLKYLIGQEFENH